MTGRTPEELHRGVLSAALRSRVEEWLAEQQRRRRDPPRQE